jgi:hypothetical protein
VIVLAAASGGIVGTGALLVQTEITVADWVVTLLVLGVLTPLHSMMLFGWPGPRLGGCPGRWCRVEMEWNA